MVKHGDSANQTQNHNCRDRYDTGNGNEHLDAAFTVEWSAALGAVGVRVSLRHVTPPFAAFWLPFYSGPIRLALTEMRQSTP